MSNKKKNTVASNEQQSKETFPRYVRLADKEKRICDVSAIEQDSDGKKHKLTYRIQFDLSEEELIEYAVRQFQIREFRTDPVNGINRRSTEQVEKLNGATFQASKFQNKQQKTSDPAKKLEKDVKALQDLGYSLEDIINMLKKNE
jgi:hypothetical protein